MAYFPNPFSLVGRFCLGVTSELGAYALFFLDGAGSIFSSPKQIKKIVDQVFFIGVKSFFLIALIGLFTGMVIGLQGYYTLVKFGSEGLLGAAVSLSLIRELGPVLTAIMVTGRAGSSMTAEIGVMRITDQIDALDVMDIRPMSYLVAPRIAASLLVFPILTAAFDIIGILGGYATGVWLLDINGGAYFHRIETNVVLADVAGGFLKAVVFGLIVSTVCCYQGYYTHLRRDGSGPQGVSNATTAAVVLSSVCILISDYVLTTFLL